MRVLIAEDDADSRNLLSRKLQAWGHEIVEAENGERALEILRQEPVSFVISDWMMPEMDGVELCRRIRNSNFDRYIYVILLTAKNEKAELVTGMESGADDFVVKPFNHNELKVRIRAGERVLKLEKDLDERNQKLREAYSVIRKDLEAAARVQKSLLPSKSAEIDGIKFEWLFLPCTFVAGDIFSFYPVNEFYVGFYHLDVSGHGIPSAMLSVTLSKILAQSSVSDSMIKRSLSRKPYYEIVPPAKLIGSLNRRFQMEDDAMQYFTMIYGLLDLRDNIMKMSQAGHPSPIVLRRNGEIQRIGEGGFPVGMLPNLEYENIECKFQRGDRLFVYSDGVTECTNSERKPFSEERLIAHLEQEGRRPLKEVLAGLKEKLYQWRGTEEFEDDISVLAMEV